MRYVEYLSKVFGKYRTPQASKQVTELIHAGRELQKTGDLDSAEKRYRKAARLDPKNHLALRLLGRLYAERGKLSEARDILESAVTLTTADAVTWTDLGNVLLLINNIDDAMSCYFRALNIDATLPTTHFNLSRAYRAIGDTEQAIKSLKKGLQLAPNELSQQYALGVLYRTENQFSRARVIFRRAEKLDPENIEIKIAIATTFLDESDYENATAEAERALVLDGDSFDARYVLASCFFNAQKYAQALAEYTRATEIDPTNLDALVNAAMSAINLTDWKLAQKFLEAALGLRPDHAISWLKLGLIYSMTEEPDEAIYAYNMAIHHDPEFAEAYYRRGNELKDQNELESAVESYKKAIELNPNFAQALCNLGVVLLRQKKHEDALPHLLKAIESEPDLIGPYGNIGLLYRELARFDEARQAFESCLKVDPNAPAGLCNFGLMLSDLGEYEAAIGYFDQALASEPDMYQAQWNKVLALLVMRRYEEGWIGYEKRRLQPDTIRRPFVQPYWDGAPLTGKRILIFGEQGLGDEIMFASCIPEILAGTEQVIIECEPRLARLFARSFSPAVVHARASLDESDWLQNHPHVDFQVSSGSLPKHFRGSVSAFPLHTGYLCADSERTHSWRRELETLGPGLKIGISWRGGTSKTLRAARSLDILQLTPFTAHPNIKLINLQYGEVEAELEQFRNITGQKIFNYEPAIKDYDETAALVTALDLVISVQTAVIHLTGALGRPVWVMIPRCAEWRYGHDGTTMPWYPSARLFRQTELGDWESVINNVTAELLKYSPPNMN